MDLFQAIRLRALKAVLHPDREYLIRRTLRWYSKTFHTPLHVVEEMPVEDVIVAYYEEQYAQMSEDQLAAEKEELLTPDEVRTARIIAEEAEEAEMFEMSQIVAAEEAAKKRAEVTKAATQKLADLQHQPLGPIKPHDLPESDLPKVPREMPEGITMSFVDDADFEAELEGFGAMGQPERKP